MLSVTTCLVIGMIGLVLYHLSHERSRLAKYINQIPGPPILPIIGNGLTFLPKRHELLAFLIQMAKDYTGVLRAWMMHQPYVILYSPENVEIVLSSSKLINKSPNYQFMHPWLGSGLVTSQGKKWHSRRKLLTPTFHFKILEDFLPIFQEHSQFLISSLERNVDDNKEINVYPYVARCMLDIITETAMGRKFKEENGKEEEFLEANHMITEVVFKRQFSPWLYPEFLFKLSPSGRQQKRAIETIHTFCKKVLQERKDAFKKESEEDQANGEAEILGQKRRLAFLDLLLEASQDGKVLSDDDILEEINTFMFGGHDTTTVCVTWALMLFGSHPEVQERAYEEVISLSSDNSSVKEYHQLKYLDCCIKETLRIYPSVHLYGRAITEDTPLKEYFLPAGTVVLISTYMTHRDPTHWPDPERFDPDRFLPENIMKRHPYSYIPFSAGPRNCIGQKYAMLELKVVLSALIRKFRVEAIDTQGSVGLVGGLTLKPQNGVQIRLIPRY